MLALTAFVFCLPAIFFDDRPETDTAQFYSPMIREFAASNWDSAFHPRVPPLFPVLGGIVAKLGIPAYPAAKIVSSLLFALCVFPLFHLHNLLWGRQVALIGVGLLMVCSRVLRYAGSGIRATGKIMLVTLLAYGMVLFLRRRSWRGATFVALGGLGLSLMWGGGIALAGIAMVFCAVVETISRQDGRWRLCWPAKSLYAALFTALLILPWIGYQYHQTGYPLTDVRQLPLATKVGRELGLTSGYERGALPIDPVDKLEKRLQREHQRRRAARQMKERLAVERRAAESQERRKRGARERRAEWAKTEAAARPRRLEDARQRRAMFRSAAAYEEYQAALVAKQAREQAREERAADAANLASTSLTKLRTGASAAVDLVGRRLRFLAAKKTWAAVGGAIEEIFKGFYPVYLLFVVPAIFLRWRRRQWQREETLLLAFIVVYNAILLATLGWVTKRYVIIIMPLMLGWAGLGIVSFGGWLKLKLPKAGNAVIGTVAVLAVLAGLWDGSKEVRRRLTGSRRVEAESVLACSRWLRENAVDTPGAVGLKSTLTYYQNGRLPVVCAIDPTVAMFADADFIAPRPAKCKLGQFIKACRLKRADYVIWSPRLAAVCRAMADPDNLPPQFPVLFDDRARGERGKMILRFQPGRRN